jgi:hypothetical protein
MAQSPDEMVQPRPRFSSAEEAVPPRLFVHMQSAPQN